MQKLLFLASLLLSLVVSCRTKTPTEPENSTPSQVALLSRVIVSPPRIGPSGSSHVSAIVIDENANPVAGKLVTFSASAGSITPSDTTGASGIAEAVYLGPAVAGPVTIFAALASQVDSAQVMVDQQIQQNLTIVAEQDAVLANGFATARLLVQAWDQNQRPLKDLPIRLTTTAGSLPALAITGSEGTASVELLAPASEQDLLATVRAASDSAEAFAQVKFLGLHFVLEVSPSRLIADGRSTAQVKATLKETTSFIAVQGAEIRFGTSLGTIANAVTTGASGVAVAELTSSSETGVALVIANYGEAIRDTVRVIMGESVPANLSLSVDRSVLVADAQSSAELKAVVSDAANNPVPDGTPVAFEIIRGSGTIESQKTTEAGIARSRLTSSDRPDTVYVAATAAGLRDTVEVRYVVGPPATLSVVSDSSSIPADGKTRTAVRAYVRDKSGNHVVDGTMVNFRATFGDISPSAETNQGLAVATFSSSQTGLAVITASAAGATDSTTVRLRPGRPNSVLLSYDPASVGVKDSGRNTTLTVTADVRDAKNNPVQDGTNVLFSIVASPGGGEFLSTDLPVPTLNGRAQVSFNAGIRSGSARIRAEVRDAGNQPMIPAVSAVSTDIIIYAGPPYIANVNDRSTSRLSVGSAPINVFGWNFVNNTATIVAVVGDKYNNPVPAGTAVYFTTTGGIISTHTGYTNEEGIATVTLHTAKPRPTITRYYETFYDPNETHPDFSLPTAVIPGPIPDFDFGEVDNGISGTGENNGIVRVLAVTEGVDAAGQPARVWDVGNVVFSGLITTFYASVSDTVLAPGEGSVIEFTIYDVNGNPIVPGSTITVSAEGGKLSWTELSTGDPGRTKYSVTLVNNLDPTRPDARETAVSVSIRVDSENGTEVLSTRPIQLKLN